MSFSSCFSACFQMPTTFVCIVVQYYSSLFLSPHAHTDTNSHNRNFTINHPFLLLFTSHLISELHHILFNSRYCNCRPHKCFWGFSTTTAALPKSLSPTELWRCAVDDTGQKALWEKSKRWKLFHVISLSLIFYN